MSELGIFYPNVPGGGDETVIEGKLNSIITKDNFDEMYELIRQHDIVTLYFSVELPVSQISISTSVRATIDGTDKIIEAGNCAFMIMAYAVVNVSWDKMDNTFSSSYNAATVNFDGVESTISDLSENLNWNVDCRMVLTKRP